MIGVEHERALSLRRRLEDVAPAVARTIEIPWRTFGFFAQLVFFVLTCIGIGALVVTTNEVFAGAASIALAEYLINKRRWWWTGVESALWIGGLFALIFSLPNSGKPEGLLLVGAACALAGWRVRNPIFGAVAADFAMHYVEKRFDLGLLFALVIATIAIVMLCRTWQRPSTEWLWVLIALALPLAGIAEADRQWHAVTIALYAVFGLLALILAIVKRHHAFFLACAIGITVATIELARDVDAPLEAKLAAGGAFLLALAFVVSRALRGRERGYVLKAERLTPADELLETAATIAIAHQPPKSSPETRTEGAGGFGGGGATGSFE